MADDKLKTGPESPGSDSPGDAPVEKAPETTAPEKVVESGASQASPPEQSVLPGIGGDAPARTAPGEVVVDFDKINELGPTVMIVTHEKGLVDEFEKRVVMIDHGSVVSDQTGGYYQA